MITYSSTKIKMKHNNIKRFCLTLFFHASHILTKQSLSKKSQTICLSVFSYSAMLSRFRSRTVEIFNWMTEWHRLMQMYNLLDYTSLIQNFLCLIYSEPTNLFFLRLFTFNSNVYLILTSRINSNCMHNGSIIIQHTRSQ